MRLRPEKIEQLAEIIYATLEQRPEIKFNGSRSDIIFEISSAIAGDLEMEDAIEVEARKLLEEHADDLRRSGVRMDEAIRKAKIKIARDKRFVL